MNVRLAYQSFGDGPPVLILHGLFGSGRNWTSIARKLARRYQVYALDLRNHGDSPWADDMSYAAMAADVVAFMNDSALAQAAIIGHSMGGKAAMAAALEHGARVSALAVVDVSPVTYGRAFLDFIEAMRAVDTSAAARRGDVEAALRPAVPDPAVRAFLLKNLVEREGKLLWRLNLHVLADRIDEIVGFPQSLLGRQYAGPALFVAGALSSYVRAENEPLIRRLFPNVSIERIDRADHWVHADQPVAFLAAVESFLRDGAAV